jgi:putative ABC transport system permease protein
MHDVRYALRGLARSPGFAAAAILTLALGIGAVTSIFSVADAVLLRPLPYPQSDRLVLVWEQLRTFNFDRFPMAFDTFTDYSGQPIFESTAAVMPYDGTLTGAGDATRALGLVVSPNIFPILGVTPILGRAFTADEAQPGHGAVAVLSHTFFVSRFGGNPNVIGRSIALNDESLTIVGVLPPGFDLSLTQETPDLWVPTIQSGGRVDMLARLRPGVSLTAAQSAMDAAAKHFDETAHPFRGPHGEDPGYRVKVASLHDELLGSFRNSVLVLICAVAAVLLIACVNVASLLWVRSVIREKETAVRRVLGASQTRLIRQWLTEGALIAAIGGVLGAIAAHWGVRLLIALSPATLPPTTHIQVDARALWFTLAVSLAVCLFFALAPALAEGRLHARLRGARPKSRAASTLIAAETALAVMLLIGAGLLLKSFSLLTHVNVGFNAAQLLTMWVELPEKRYPEPYRRLEFISNVRHQIAALPGVVSATASTRIPINSGANIRGADPFSIEGRSWNASGSVPQLGYYQVSDEVYFRTLQIPLIAGRAFNDSDTASAPFVTVINETLARGFFPNGDAVGHRILAGAPRPDSKWLTIVGIVGDVKTATLDGPAIPHFYVPVSQHTPSYLHFTVRTLPGLWKNGPMAIARRAAAVVRSVEPDAPVSGVQTMQQRVASSVSQPRFETLILAFFAAAALFLAAIGIFGVVAHSTARRTQEIGIRMALGADRARVVRYVLSGGLRPVVIGAVIGLVSALALGRALASFLFHVTPRDPQIFTLAVVTLLAVAIAACFIPARKASRIDPMNALRSE